MNALWKGLGYYSRASRLLAGAQKVAKELGGLLPGNAKDMEAKIPGIGRYSAGAICSIAYGEKVPVVSTSHFLGPFRPGSELRNDLVGRECTPTAEQVPHAPC